MNKVHKDDRVTVRVGKDEGKQGAVLAVLAEHVTAEGVNVTRRHVRPNPMLGATDGVVNRVIPTHISNAALVDVNGKPSRVDIRVEGGVKTRVLKTAGATVDA